MYVVKEKFMKTLIAYFSHVGETLADNNVVIIEKGNNTMYCRI